MITVDHTANLAARILVLDYTRGRRKCGFLAAEDSSLAVCTPLKNEDVRNPMPRLRIQIQMETCGCVKSVACENTFGKQFGTQVSGQEEVEQNCIFLRLVVLFAKCYQSIHSNEDISFVHLS